MFPQWKVIKTNADGLPMWTVYPVHKAIVFMELCSCYFFFPFDFFGPGASRWITSNRSWSTWCPILIPIWDSFASFRARRPSNSCCAPRLDNLFPKRSIYCKSLLCDIMLQRGGGWENKLIYENYAFDERGKYLSLISHLYHRLSAFVTWSIVLSSFASKT